MALDTELHREVALKQILESDADDPTSRQRFLDDGEVRRQNSDRALDLLRRAARLGAPNERNVRFLESDPDFSSLRPSSSS